VAKAAAAGALDRPTRREGEDRRVTFDAGVARAIDLRPTVEAEV